MSLRVDSPHPLMKTTFNLQSRSVAQGPTRCAQGKGLFTPCEDKPLFEEELSKVKSQRTPALRSDSSKPGGRVTDVDASERDEPKPEANEDDASGSDTAKVKSGKPPRGTGKPTKKPKTPTDATPAEEESEHSEDGSAVAPKRPPPIAGVQPLDNEPVIAADSPDADPAAEPSDNCTCDPTAALAELANASTAAAQPAGSATPPDANVSTEGETSAVTAAGTLPTKPTKSGLPKVGTRDQGNAIVEDAGEDGLAVPEREAPPAGNTAIELTGEWEPQSAGPELSPDEPSAAPAHDALQPLGTDAPPAPPVDMAAPAHATTKPNAVTELPPAPEARFAEANHPSIVKSVHGELLPNGGTMKIRLDPPELGSMQITVQMRDGQMVASFETTSDQATSLLSHSLTQLKSALETQGVQVDKLHVQQAPREQAFDPQGGRGQDPSSREGSSQQEQQRKEMLRRMWQRLGVDYDPLDMVA